MNSTNDTTILAMLSRFPDMPAEEANEYIARIEHEENIPVCHAVIGQIPREDLLANARQTYDEFKRWSTDRTRRIQSEEWSSRRRRQETRTALNLNRLKEKGLATEEMLLMYGISGELPERNMYEALNSEEKQALWAERMESRFGPNWENAFDQQMTRLPFFRFKEIIKPNWLIEGF